MKFFVDFIILFYGNGIWQICIYVYGLGFEWLFDIIVEMYYLISGVNVGIGLFGILYFNSGVGYC